MLVFPTLGHELQDAWDELEGDLLQNFITEQVVMDMVISLPTPTAVAG